MEISDKPASQWQDWRAVTIALNRLSMELEQFLALYPGITRDQLAKVADCTIDVVNRWFLKEKQRKPTDYHKLRFALAHWIRVSEQAKPGAFEELKNIMQEISNS